MKTKHTPGPWGIHRDNQLDCDIAYIRDSENNEIAIVYNAAEGSDNAAHARLIAAAPELVAALEGCVELVGDFIASFRAQLSPAAIAGLKDKLKPARAALEKAGRGVLEKAGRGVEGGGE